MLCKVMLMLYKAWSAANICMQLPVIESPHKIYLNCRSSTKGGKISPKYTSRVVFDLEVQVREYLLY